MLPVLAAITTFLSTAAGGGFALRYRRYLRHILGFTAGVLLGVVAFDIMPELFNLVASTHTNPIWPMVALVCGFLLFHITEKLVAPHHAHEDGKIHGRQKVGLIAALALSAHSFFDGVGIGLAFQINTAIGLTVALAVIAHDYSDGLNTVSLMLANGNSLRSAQRLLLLDAVAPILGAASTLLFTLPDRWLLAYLGFFAGFLLYIAASNILPEAHRERTSKPILVLTVAGVVFIFVVTRISL